MASQSDYALDARIWDVKHGSAAYLKAVNKDVVIDCGASGDFSPLQWLRSPKFGINNIHYMIISHPHRDHIQDLHRVEELEFRPNIINRPKKARELVEDAIEEARREGDDAYIEDAEYYLELDEEFSGDPNPSPKEPEWSREQTNSSSGGFRTDGGLKRGPWVTFHNYGTGEIVGDDRFEKLNNLSKITVVNAGEFKMVLTGDLLPPGIEKVMRDTETMKDVKDADILIAPHHGRDTSYVEEFVDQINPSLVVFSDKGVDNAATEEYREHGDDVPIYYEQTGVRRTKSVVETAEVGRIRLQANIGGDYAVSVNEKDSTESLAATHQYNSVNKY
jgi:competence protein ComEC